MKILILIIFSFLFCIKSDKNIDNKYFGGWPTNEEKNTIIGNKLDYKCPNNIGCECNLSQDCINQNCVKTPRGSYCFPKEGDIFPNFTAIDQYEEFVEIYDFANQGKYIVVELGATWCRPCNELASFLSYNDLGITKNRQWKESYNILYDLIQNDEIFFITILYEDENKNNSTYDTVYEWFDNYPDEKIPILSDSDKLLHTWIKPSGIPAITLLNENMEIIKFSSRGWMDAFDELLIRINVDRNIETKNNKNEKK